MRKLWQTLKRSRGDLIATGFFLVFIFGWGAANLASALPELADGPSENGRWGFDTATISYIEDTYTKEFAAQSAFVEVHGALQRAMGKREVGNFDVVKAADGKLLPGYEGNHVLVPPEEHTVESLAWLAEFNAFCKAQNTPFLYVQLPDWIIEGYTGLPAGVEEYQNQNHDEKLAVMAQLGVDTLDLRAAAREDGLDPAGLFFKTDHHWTIETAFWAHTVLLRTFEDGYGLTFPDSSFMCDIGNYNLEVYEDCFLGSAGRRTGQAYDGIDDFTLITPAFDTELTYDNPGRWEQPKTGPFDGVAVDRGVLESSDPLYRGLRYDAYLHGFTPKASLRNEAGQNRILVVQDSYGQALCPFLALSFAEVDMLDFRYYEGGTLAQYIEENGPFDMVVCLNQLDAEKFI